MSETTIPERSRMAISDNRERQAIRLLKEAGWSVRELAMVFECNDSTISRVLNRGLIADGGKPEDPGHAKAVEAQLRLAEQREELPEDIDAEDES